MVLSMFCSSFQKSQSFFTETQVCPGPCWKSFVQHQENQKKKNPSKQIKKNIWQQTSWRCASGQTCDGPSRDLLAWKGDRDPQAVEGQSCPSPYIKYPEAQFGPKVGRISLTQQPSDQALYTPLVYSSYLADIYCFHCHRSGSQGP